jgi:hypothetical protein
VIETPARTTARRAALLGAAALLLLPACSAEQSPEEAARAGAEAAAAAAAAAAAGTRDGESTATAASPGDQAGATTLVQLDVRGGEVDGPTRTVVPLGEVVRLTVTSHAPDEVHVHGYDRTLDLQPGTPATVEFVADIPGVFEVELHESGLPLTSLQVQ